MKWIFGNAKFREHLSVIWPFWLDSQEVRRDTNHSSNKCFSQNTFNLGNLKSHSDTLGASYTLGGKFDAILSAVKDYFSGLRVQ